MAGVPALTGRARPPPPHPASASTSAATADKLKKLGELHASGILTDEEFAAKKAELLKEI